MPLQPPPSLPLDEITRFVAERFGLVGSYRALDGERDQNHRLDSNGKRYVVKVCSADEGIQLASEQARALRHIAKSCPLLPVPRCHADADGAFVPVLACDGKDYPVLVLDWIEGEAVGERQLSREQYIAWGDALGRLNKSLVEFSSQAIARRKLDWNTARFAETGLSTRGLTGAEAALLDPVLSTYEAFVVPRLLELPAQVIHGDVHPHNTLLSSRGDIAGIIDFGDLVHAPRLLDLSNAIGDCLVPGHDFERVTEGLVSGFTRHVQLTQDEISLLLPLAQMRMAVSYLVARARQAETGQITPQIEAMAGMSLDVLRQLRSHDMTDVIGRAAGKADLMERRVAAMGPRPLLFYDKPLHMVSGQGVWLTASDGRRYLDCYNNVPHVGHAHPHVAEAVARQLRVLNTNTRYLTDESIAYAERLKATLHPSLDTVIFVNSGSEANDVAWRMANVFTGHRGALCMDFAYHGITMASDMLSPSNYPSGKWSVPHVRQMEAPDLYRGPVGCAHVAPGEAYAAMVDPLIADLQSQTHGVSIAIIDSAFMTNGILDAPEGYVHSVADRVRKAGGLFIADEVQSGFGRMGTHMWGHQHHGVVPDFVTIGKPAGNGYPVGAIITRAEILERFIVETGPFFSTFGGGNAACAAGLAVLDVMDSEGLLSNSLETGNYFRAGVRDLMGRFELIGDVRGSGLATGIELVGDRKSKKPVPRETRDVINRLKDQGVLVGSDGKLGNVLKIRPPLVFSREHADFALSALARVMQAMG